MTRALAVGRIRRFQSFDERVEQLLAEFLVVGRLSEERRDEGEAILIGIKEQVSHLDEDGTSVELARMADEPSDRLVDENRVFGAEGVDGAQLVVNLLKAECKALLLRPDVVAELEDGETAVRAELGYVLAPGDQFLEDLLLHRDRCVRQTVSAEWQEPDERILTGNGEGPRFRTNDSPQFLEVRKSAQLFMDRQLDGRIHLPFLNELGKLAQDPSLDLQLFQCPLLLTFQRPVVAQHLMR